MSCYRGGSSNQLFQEVGKRKEQEKSNNVAVDWENKFANAHVKGSSGDHMEAGVAKLQGQHGRMQLNPFRNGAPHSGGRGG